MAETSDRLPTGNHESPANIGPVPSLRLSPRFTAERVESRTTQGIRPDLTGQTGTNAPRVSGQFAGASDETSDRLPTNGPQTSDRTTVGSQGDATSTLGRQLDERLRLRLAQLEVLPGAISGKGLEQTSASSEKGLPISWSGQAKGDTVVFVFRRRIAGARSIAAKAAVLKDLNAEIQQITVSRRKGRPEYDLSVKEGRIAAGRLAEEHGVAWACESLNVPAPTMYRYRDEYRKTK